jgi:multidrug resistance efflux pump
MMTTFYGVWSEVVLATYASVIWWATPAGTLLHELSYMVILSGGIFCVLVNWNPFAKMDGYILVTEFFRMHDIKTTTTNWLISWIRVCIFHLPGEVQPVSRLRAACYAGYALLSGVYCYGLLLFFVRILYHIVYAYTPQWAFLPAWLLALRIFRSRIIELGQFMKELYLDKKELLRARRKPILAGACALLALGLLPLRRERITESFVVEPAQRAVLRAQVPGRVVDIGADEGQHVTAGTMLVKVRDLGVQTNAARSKAEYEVAAAHTIGAQLRYADYAAAEQNRRAAQTAQLMSQGKEQQLTIRTPINGMVITPRLHDLLGSYLAEGTQVAEIVDTSRVRARVFVPQSEMHKLSVVHHVRLRMDGHWGSVNGTVFSVSPASQQPDAVMVATSSYQGIKLPDFFVVTIEVANPRGDFRDGMTGTAKIYGRWESVLGALFEPLTTAVARRLW